MKKIVLVLIASVFMVQEAAAYLVPCDNSAADCPLGETKCTVTGPNGVEIEGTVVYREFNDPNLQDGHYCEIPGRPELSSPPICPGGDLLLFGDEVVGCRFQQLGANEREACQPLKIMPRSKWTATCHVCIREDLVGLVTDHGAWDQLSVLGGGAADKVAADFSCLQGSPMVVDSQPNPDIAIRRIGISATLIPDGPDATATDGWTPWLNRDNPGGSGDFEGLQDFVKAGKACPVPVDIQCRTRDGRDWRDAGQEYICDPTVGGICRNQAQKAGRCLDYEVRFRCTSEPQLALTCNDDQSRCECDSAHSCAILKLICAEWGTTRHGLVGHDCRATNSDSDSLH